MRRISNSNLYTFGLFSFIFIASFVCDKYVANSLLSLPLLLATSTSIIAISIGLPILKKLRFNQLIRQEGPKEHFKKTGTPTMGGIIVVPIGIIIGNLVNFSEHYNEKITAISLITMSFMLIGIADDLLSKKNKENAGLNPTWKISLQIILGLIFITWAFNHQWINSEILLYQNTVIDIGFLIWPLALFVIIAESNATNLTDGLDGLASGCGALVFTGLAIELMLRGNNNDPILGGYCIAMAGSWLGFLFFNQNPAKIFMGDTGSLPMGAALSSIALLSNNLWILLIMGGVFLAECISVIIQVGVFKISKKIYGTGFRVLKMAPLHHHFELSGINELKIVRNFWLATLGLILISFLLRPDA